MYDLIIDKEFKDLIPPLTQYEFDLLEQNCIKDGIRESISVWNKIIIDGHNRYAIAKKNNLPFRIVEYNFNNRSEVIDWIRKNQLGRRNASWILKKCLKAGLSKKGSEDYNQLSLFKSSMDKISDAIGYTKARKLFNGDYNGISEGEINRIAEKSEEKIIELLDPLLSGKTDNIDTAKAQIRKNKKKKLQDWEVEMARLIHEDGYTRFDAYCEVRKESIKSQMGKYRSIPIWMECLVSMQINNPKEKVHETIKDHWDRFVANHEINPFEAFDSYITEAMIGNIVKTLNVLRDLFYFMDLIDCKSFKNQIQKNIANSYDKLKRMNNPDISNQVNKTSIENILNTKL